VPVLEGLVARHILRDVGLDAAAAVLQRGEACLAHHALEHHAPGDARLRARLLERLLAAFSVPRGELAGEVLAAEVVGIGDVLGAQRPQLLPAFLDELVLFFHAPYTPCLRLAVMKSSSSPSSTACVAPFPTPGRRSLMRDWSST